MSYYAIDNPMRRRKSGNRVTYLHSVAGAISKVLKWREKRRAIAVLQKLDDRLLDDIGLARNDIPNVVTEFFASGDFRREQRMA